MTVTVYTKPHCAQCDATTRFLDRAGIPWTAAEITDEVRDELAEAGHLSAPVVVVQHADGRTQQWSGYRHEHLHALSAEWHAVEQMEVTC